MSDRRPTAKCPICGKAAAPATRPFCSPHCADVDLGRWLTGQYRISGPPSDRDDEQLPTPPDAA